MKYIPVPEFELVTSALNFNTPDCNVTGGCDLYTTKSTSTDKKLFKAIDEKFNVQHDEFLKFSKNLSQPEKAAVLSSSPNLSMLSQLSAFGPLSDLNSRRIFAYMISTLNASHPHYDFSDMLRPDQFKRERSLRSVMSTIDSILQNVRSSADMNTSPDDVSSGPQLWSLIDKEMKLAQCAIFSFQPNPDPFQEDECAIWTLHHFFYNRLLKRVAYFYLRVVPVVSSQSPQFRLSSMTAGHNQQHGSHYLMQNTFATVGGNGIGGGIGSGGAGLVGSYRSIQEEEDEGLDDGFFWNRDEDGDLVPFSDETYGALYEGEDVSDEDVSDLDEPSSPMDVNEDTVARMEVV